MPKEKKEKSKSDYEVEETERSGKEIEDLIEKLQNLNYGEHVHLQTSETLCF